LVKKPAWKDGKKEKRLLDEQRLRTLCNRSRRGDAGKGHKEEKKKQKPPAIWEARILEMEKKKLDSQKKKKGEEGERWETYA